jgi:hypothetical protein
MPPYGSWEDYMNATATPATGRWTPRRIAVWIAIALLGAVAWGILALARGESVNAGWLIVTACARTPSPTGSTPGSSPTGCWASTTTGPPRLSG